MDARVEPQRNGALVSLRCHTRAQCLGTGSVQPLVPRSFWAMLTSANGHYVEFSTM